MHRAKQCNYLVRETLQVEITRKHGSGDLCNMKMQIYRLPSTCLSSLVNLPRGDHVLGATCCRPSALRIETTRHDVPYGIGNTYRCCACFVRRYRTDPPILRSTLRPGSAPTNMRRFQARLSVQQAFFRLLVYLPSPSAQHDWHRAGPKGRLRPGWNRFSCSESYARTRI
jgi:hypothetical protein